MIAFRRCARLLTPQAFDRVFKQGKRMAVGPLLAVIAPNDAQEARIGFALSRKASPHAVQRNRLRRVLRERFRLARAHWHAVDVVITQRGKLESRAAEQTALDALWKTLDHRCRR